MGFLPRPGAAHDVKEVMVTREGNGGDEEERKDFDNVQNSTINEKEEVYIKP
jgi:hypothetical protein